MNKLALEACGYTREQVLNRPFWSTPWWRGSEEMQARIRLATDQAASGSIFHEELRYWVADGSERVVDFAMHPIRDQSGAVMCLYPTGIDITDASKPKPRFAKANSKRAGWHLSSSLVMMQLLARPRWHYHKLE